MLPGADVEAASVPEGANGSALGGLSPWGGGNTPQNTPDFLAMLHEYELFEPEVAACLWFFGSPLVYCSSLCGSCTTCLLAYPWAAWYNTWLLIKLTPKGAVFSFLFLLAYHHVVGMGMLDILLGNLGFEQMCLKQQSCV